MLYMAAAAIYCNAVKGVSVLQLTRVQDLQYKTSFVIAHKLHESVMVQRD